MIGDSNEQSGTVGFLVGIIILVFAGIVFSLLADKRFQFSSGQASLEEEVDEGKRHVARLEARVEASRELWKKRIQPLEDQGQELQAARDELRASGSLLASLRQLRESLEKDLQVTGDVFRAYRDQYRKQVRLAAIGEQHSELRSQAGRTYSDVTITRVTVDGVDFKHSQGISRLSPDELDPSWLERFQWHPEERLKVAPPVVAKAQAEVAVKPVENPSGEESSPEQDAKDEAEKKLAGLRRDVNEALRYLRKAEGERDRARSEARNSRARSVPGSLETWEEKVARMESLCDKFRVQYAVARGKLAAVAPGDPLLQTPEP